jgi:hypothetical protein
VSSAASGPTAAASKYSSIRAICPSRSWKIMRIGTLIQVPSRMVARARTAIQSVCPAPVGGIDHDRATYDA